MLAAKAILVLMTDMGYTDDKPVMWDAYFHNSGGTAWWLHLAELSEAQSTKHNPSACLLKHGALLA